MLKNLEPGMKDPVNSTATPHSPAKRRAVRNRRVALGRDLGIEHVAALKEHLLKVAETPARLVLDASEVERVHTAALQLFCLLCRDRRSAGRDIEFARPSPTLRSAAALLGATTLLQLARAMQ
jgi:anti-anti-sigma regulatory factor